jgi:hypothetical protein
LEIASGEEQEHPRNDMLFNRQLNAGWLIISVVVILLYM